MRSYLITLRKNKQLTQEEISNDLGISRAFYGMIENGTRNPSLKLAVKIAMYFNERMENIFFNDKATK